MRKGGKRKKRRGKKEEGKEDKRMKKEGKKEEGARKKKRRREEKKGTVCTMSFFFLNFAAQKEGKGQNPSHERDSRHRIRRGERWKAGW